MNDLLKVTNLKKTYFNPLTEIEAIKDFSFTVKEYEFIALVGPSGCGKSTILSILNDLETKTSGNIEIKENTKIGYMLQQDCLFNWLNIKENCLLGLKIQNNCTKENEERVLNLISKYGLSEFINDYPSNLSGGMRQRVALIRTLATDPDILLLDEPFSALDFQKRQAVSNDVYKIIKNEKKAAIIVTHDISEAITFADKVIVLSQRPASIKNIYELHFNEDEPIKRRTSKEFNEYYTKIWGDIDE